MNIDQLSLLVVAVVSAVVALAVVAMVAVAVVGLSPPAGQHPSGATTRRVRGGVALAVACVVAALSLVSYGIYVIAV